MKGFCLAEIYETFPSNFYLEMAKIKIQITTPVCIMINMEELFNSS